MEFFEVVRKRRSVRSYQKVNIPKEWAKKILGIPDNKRFIIILPIGKAYQIPQKKEKKKISEITHHNKYGIKYL